MTLGFTISLCIVVLSTILFITFGFAWYFRKDSKKSNRISYRYLTALGVITLATSMPFLINESYKQNIGYITVWGGKDLLAFYGSVLSFGGTVFLGGLALWQNQQFKKASNKQEKINIAIQNYPLFEFGDIEYFFYDEIQKENKGISIDSGLIPVKEFNGNKMIWQTFSSQNCDFLNIRIQFRNIGNTLATGIYIESEIDKSRNKNNVLDEDSDPIKHVLPGNKGIALLNVPLSRLRKSKEENYLLIFSNPFGSKYEQLIQVMLKHNGKIIEIQTLINLQIKED